MRRKRARTAVFFLLAASPKARAFARLPVASGPGRALRRGDRRAASLCMSIAEPRQVPIPVPPKKYTAPEDCDFEFCEHRKLPKVMQGVVMYWDYVQWLWRSTSRYRLDQETGRAGLTERMLAATSSITALEQDYGEELRGSEFSADFTAAVDAVRRLRDEATRVELAKQRALCQALPSTPHMGANAGMAPPSIGTLVNGANGALSPGSAVKAETQRVRSPLKNRVKTGFIMGALGTLWIFSGNWVFASGFFFQSVLAQLEYYRMAMHKGNKPARRISLVTTALLFVSAVVVPSYHDHVLANAGLYIMLYFLLMRRTPAGISDISTTFMGIFYAAYLPSFWVRLRCLGAIEPTKWLAFQHVQQAWPKFLPALMPSPSLWTQGAIITWWTYLSIVAADVGAFAFGKSMGRTKLSKLSASAGYASPNKTVEGVAGGLLCSVLMSMFGAWMLNWPLWLLSGALYGSMLALVGLVGDLTASMFKRDAGFKDSGNILPGHGGYLDRVDSYIFTAAPSFLFVTVGLPLFRRLQTILLGV